VIRWRSAVIGVGSSLVLVTAIACGPAPRPDPNVITVAVQASPASFDPRVGTDEVSQRVHQLVFDQLMRVDDQLRVVPGLALRLEQPDPLTWVAHLRSGVRFHDGREMTARDVVYTFRSFLDPDFVSARKGAYRMLESVRAIDDYTVEFRLNEPSGSFPVQLVMAILPEGAGESPRTAPVGTGPYVFTRYVADDRVELRAFGRYWDGAPLNTGVVLKIVPDETMRALELRKGTVDLVIGAVSPDVAHRLERDGLQVVQGPGVDYAYITFNFRDPVVADRRVRHAIAHAVNRQAIVDYLRRGLAAPAAGILAPMAWAYEPDVHEFRYDPDQALRLLDEAGYPDPGDGRPRLRLTLQTSTDEFFRLQAAVIQQDLRRVGIALDVRAYEFATFYDDILAGRFQMATMQWVGVTDPDMLRRVFHSAQMPPVGFNRGGYHNPEVDRLIERAATAEGEEAQRKAWADVQRLVAEEAPYVSLWHKTNIAVIRPDLSGIRLRPQLDYRVLRHVKRLP
jgi:peptide/nickel transport system substrate-binding protein